MISLGSKPAGAPTRTVRSRASNAVWAEPDEDAPRLVLADFLNEHAERAASSSRCSRAGKLSTAGRKREEKLLSRMNEWSEGPDPLDLVTREARFERGFVIGCHLAADVELEPRLVDHPVWSTIREYVLDSPRRMSSRLVHRLRAHGAREVDVLVCGID
jgi:uncharacterized protein (TIGR02996 family)